MRKLIGFFVVFTSLAFSAMARQYEGLATAYGDSINSVYDEQAPVFTPDGKSVYFTRSNHPQNIGGVKDKGDIWYSQLQADGIWSTPVHAGKQLNTSGYNAVVGFGRNGNTLFLQNLYENGRGGRQGVSIATRSGNGWSDPRPVDIPYFYNRAPHQSMSLSPDGTVMLMAVEARFSYGAEDIYVSLQRPGGKWSEPINLGRTINTRYQEMTPHLAADNKTLYFASNGHGGLGSRDIFVSTRLDDTWKNWSEPKNLGSSINSPGVELSYFVPANSEYAYFTTTQNSDGYGDLRRIRLSPESTRPEVASEPVVEVDTVATEPVLAVEEVEVNTSIIDSISQPRQDEPVLVEDEPAMPAEYTFSGRVNDQRSGQGVVASIRAVNSMSNDTLTVSSGTEGAFRFSLTPGETYTIKASAKGYLPNEIEIEATGTGEEGPIVIELVPLEIGTTVQLDNILFRQGTSEMLAGSEKDLKQVLEVLNENPGLHIELAGHTDNRGSGRLNIKLSQARVEAVKAYLVEQGIDKKRIEGVGYGGTRPIASNATEETRRLNRRVEFTITGK
ncbi:OmpA family protein [Roseivirga sp. BDSF3-8]|uniref:OmpA family protein n=1 Tax=Roseivirga sp. BDSF3-8 TaxID=3241598 RepID=UPI003531F6DF